MIAGFWDGFYWGLIVGLCVYFFCWMIYQYIRMIIESEIADRVFEYRQEMLKDALASIDKPFEKKKKVKRND